LNQQAGRNQIVGSQELIGGVGLLAFNEVSLFSHDDLCRLSARSW